MAVPRCISAAASPRLKRAAVSVAMIQISRQGPGFDQGSTRNRKNIETSTASRIARTTIPSDSMIAQNSRDVQAGYCAGVAAATGGAWGLALGGARPKKLVADRIKRRRTACAQSISLALVDAVAVFG